MCPLQLSESGRTHCGQSPLRSLALLGDRILDLLMLLILPALWPAARMQGQAANAVSSSPSLPTTPPQLQLWRSPEPVSSPAGVRAPHQ